MAQVTIDGIVQEARPDELLIDLISRTGASIPHVCYHPQLGPVQTCDTCMVEADGPPLRACATRVADGSEGAPSERVTNNLAAQKEPSAINHPRPGAL